MVSGEDLETNIYHYYKVFPWETWNQTNIYCLMVEPYPSEKYDIVNSD